MSSIWSNHISLSLFGESHGDCVGMTLNNMPAGFDIDMNQLNNFIKLRSASNLPDISTTRHEKDSVNFISGLMNNVTTGSPITAIISNLNKHSWDYDKLRFTPRPSHGDYTNYIKFNGLNDYRGGGHCSGRITAALNIAGAIALQILASKKIFVCSHILSIHNIFDHRFDLSEVSLQDFHTIENNKLPVLNSEIIKPIIKTIKKYRLQKDSVGGSVQTAIIGIPAGIGSPIFDNLESLISSIVFAIPGVRGLEFGQGFNAALMLGSKHNDHFTFINDSVKTLSNNHSGILAGISSGMPIVFNTAFKPTSSIASQQQSVNLISNSIASLSISGRHDPCFVPRAVPVVSSAAAIAILSELIKDSFF